MASSEMFLRARVPVNPHLTSKNKWSICKECSCVCCNGIWKITSFAGKHTVLHNTKTKWPLVEKTI